MDENDINQVNNNNVESTLAVKRIHTTSSSNDNKSGEWRFWPYWYNNSKKPKNDDDYTSRTTAEASTICRTTDALFIHSPQQQQPTNTMEIPDPSNIYQHNENEYITKHVSQLTTNISNYMSTIHPGHYCMMTSLPLLFYTYYGYKHYPTTSERLVQQILQQKQQQQQQQIAAAAAAINTTTTAVTTESLPLVALEESIRRSIAVAVASRALRIATTGMVGLFIGGIGMVLYSTIPMNNNNNNTKNNYYHNSISHVLPSLQQSSRKYLQNWEIYIRSIFQNPNPTVDAQQPQRYNEDHPEYQKIQSMTEEEELEYIYETYIKEHSSTDTDNPIPDESR